MRSITLTLTGNTTDFTTSLQPPIRLDPKKEYEAAFLSLETYNSIPNITENNNTFKYSTDNGNTWKIIKLPMDAYEYTQIADEIQRQMVVNNDFKNKTDESKTAFYINFSICRLSSLIEITNPTYKIDFGVENSIGSSLGFNDEVLSLGVHKSPKIVDITSINSILINVDFIEGGYTSIGVNNARVRTEQASMKLKACYSHAIHNFSPKVGPGYKIFEQPSPELIFYRVSKDFIPDVRVWLTDQNQDQIDLQGERVTIRILLREVNASKK